MASLPPKLSFEAAEKKASASDFSASSFYILWSKATNLEKCFLSVCLSHSGSNWLKSAEIKFTWCDFMNFSRQFSAVHMNSGSGHWMSFIFKICQIVADISVTSQFYESFNPIFGGFSHLAPMSVTASKNGGLSLSFSCFYSSKESPLLSHFHPFCERVEEFLLVFSQLSFTRNSTIFCQKSCLYFWWKVCNFLSLREVVCLIWGSGYKAGFWHAHMEACGEIFLVTWGFVIHLFFSCHHILPNFFNIKSGNTTGGMFIFIA